MRSSVKYSEPVTPFLIVGPGGWSADPCVVTLDSHPGSAAALPARPWARGSGSQPWSRAPYKGGSVFTGGYCAGGMRQRGTAQHQAHSASSGAVGHCCRCPCCCNGLQSLFRAHAQRYGRVQLKFMSLATMVLMKSFSFKNEKHGSSLAV